MTNLKFWLIGSFICLLVACGEQQPKSDSSSELQDIDNINIRISKDPLLLHPIYSPSSAGRELFQYIFTPLADFHPQTLELSPIIIKEIPKPYIHDVNRESWVTYLMDIKEDAKWSDGQPITAKDVKFTLNVISHPNAPSTPWKSYFSQIKSITLEDKNDRKFGVSFDAGYMLALEAVTSISILPAHIYDSQGIITELELLDFMNADPSEDPAIVEVFKKISESKNQKLDVVQAGPYKLTAFEPNQYYLLERIPNYWGAAYPEVPILNTNSEKLTFQIVPDELTASTMLKEDKLDLVQFSKGSTFLNMRDDELVADKFNFHIPSKMTYYYIGINNSRPLLADKNVRKALAHIADVDDFIKNLEGGLGTRTTGHFNPLKPYYNDNLKPIPYDINKAKKILEEEGWQDSNNDGILDKTIDGQQTDLELDMYITGSALSKNMALLYQESAKEAGIKINIEAKKPPGFINDYILKLNYDLALLVTSQDVSTDDPYNRFHSDNKKNTNLNPIAYGNPELDILIDKLRLERNRENQKTLFHEVQSFLYNEYPSIYLYCPVGKIVVSNKFDATTSSKRPGYMANTFKPKS